MLVVGAQGDGAAHVPFFVDVQDGADGDRVAAPLAVDEDDSEAAVDDHYYRWWMTPAGTSKSPEDCTSRLSCYKTKRKTIQKVGSRHSYVSSSSILKVYSPTWLLFSCNRCWIMRLCDRGRPEVVV